MVSASFISSRTAGLSVSLSFISLSSSFLNSFSSPLLVKPLLVGVSVDLTLHVFPEYALLSCFFRLNIFLSFANSYTSAKPSTFSLFLLTTYFFHFLIWSLLNIVLQSSKNRLICLSCYLYPLMH